MRQTNSKLKNTLKTAGDFLSTFITAIVAITAISLIVIKLLGCNMFSIDSPSMSPKFPVDTLIIVQKIQPENIKPGDVITYILNEDGLLVTHRVVKVNIGSKTFITKGDANNTQDAAPVQWENTVGKVIFGIPKLGKPMRFLTSEKNRPFVISAIVLLFAVSLIWDISSRKNKQEKPKRFAKRKKFFNNTRNNSSEE